jgi:8-oxo-dGTP pyrophosphatase MutT (NUDIX family)
MDAREMETITYTAAGGVIIHERQVLLLDRPARGEVRLPKGHVDPGEAVAETALRETAEESGYYELAVVADLGSNLVEFDYEARHYARTEHYFLLRKLGDGQQPRPPKDAEQFRPIWVELDEAAARLTYPAEQEVVRRAIALYASLA